MANTRQIIKHRDSVANIAKITGTMEMVATAKYRKVSTRLQGARPYAEHLAQLVGDLARDPEVAQHPLLAENADVRKVVLLVLCSNRGLCGGYNGALVRMAQDRLRELTEAGFDVDLHVSGKKGIGYFRFKDQPLSATYEHFDDAVEFDAVCRLADDLIERYRRREIAAVHVVYTRFVSTARHYPLTIKLLPFRQLARVRGKARRVPRMDEYLFTPGLHRILDGLVPAMVRAALFYCVMDAVVTEQVARMTAMTAATDNAEQMIEALGRQYNRARQAQITSEMLDIVGGTEALK